MTNLVAYRHPHLTKVLNRTPQMSKMAIEKDNREMLLCGDVGVVGKRAGCHLPMDLSKRASNRSWDGGEVEVTDGETVDDCDEPLNLSTSKSWSAEYTKDSSSNNDDLLRKRERLEDMVTHLRHSSVTDPHKCQAKRSSAGLERGGSEADSEGEVVDKRVTNGNIANRKGQSSANRRKSNASYMGEGRVTDGHREPHLEQLQGSYPVLRQQLQRSVMVVDDDKSQEDEPSDVVDDDGELRAKLDDGRKNVTMLQGSTVTDNASSSVIKTLAGSFDHYPLYALYYAATAVEEERRRSFPVSARGLLVTTAPPSVTDDDTPSINGRQQEHPGTPNNNNKGTDASTEVLLRKRAPRALTGKHVKDGTGASATTLLSLKQKIEQKKINQQTLETASKMSVTNRLRHQEKNSNRRPVTRNSKRK